VNSQPFGDWEADENGTKGRKDYGKTEFGQDPDISVEDINHISHVPVTFTLSTSWMHTYLGTIGCKFGRNPTILVGWRPTRRTDFCEITKVPVSSDLSP